VHRSRLLQTCDRGYFAERNASEPDFLFDFKNLLQFIHISPARDSRCLGCLQDQSSPVMNWARPYPKDQSSSAFCVIETTTSDALTPNRTSRTGYELNKISRTASEPSRRSPYTAAIGESASTRPACITETLEEPCTQKVRRYGKREIRSRRAPASMCLSPGG
jgi:hypothetical protein